MADEGLEGALKLVQEGKTREAHDLLEKLVNSDVHNITAWLWYARTAPSARERTRILEACLRLNPEDADTRRILGLEPEPQAKIPVKAAPQSQNSLAFTAPGSIAPKAESGQSTQPLRSFVPPVPPSQSARVPNRSRISTWLLPGLALLLLAFCAVAGWIAYNAIPK
jgi:hypothetical protein